MLKSFIIFFLTASLCTLSYMLGFYRGSCKLILFEQYMWANSNISKMAYLKKGSYAKVESLTLSELESSIDTLNFTSHETRSLIKLINIYHGYNDLANCVSLEDIIRTKKRYINMGVSAKISN